MAIRMPARHNDAMSRVSSRPAPEPAVDPGPVEDELKLSDEELEDIGKRVKEARRLKEMSQVALATEVGVGQTYLSRIEAGKRQLSLAVLVRIAKALGQPIGWIAANESPGPVARAPVNWDQRDQRRKRDPRGK